MDRLIKRFDAEPDADLTICSKLGVAYQRDMEYNRVPYDSGYLAKVDSYDGSPIAKAVNAGRLALLGRHLSPGATVLDYGAGSGAFVRDAIASGFAAKGYEVIPEAIVRLERMNAYATDPFHFDAVTLWDSLEHMDVPERGLQSIKKGAYLFASVPVFEDLRAIRKSKHYRPGEHLYYWTPQGFIDWAALYGFRWLETSLHEIDAGRESIGAFAFKRDLPDYHDHLLAYQEIHSTRYYGSSATELHLSTIADVVKRVQPNSILDYGCGRSDLASHFWLDGARKISRYDPAIPTYKRLPEGKHDLVFVCDVMEHVPMSSVDRVLSEVQLAARDAALFTISTKLARAKLPDGRNAHVTLLNRGEWERWLRDVFIRIEFLPSQWDHELVVLAGGRAVNAWRT